MPFYIRKSVSVGPFRFNLSKSGIGVSAGVKGFRVGTGPRGHYIHAGRGGLYYRSSIPSGGKARPFAPQPQQPSPRAPATYSEPNVEMVRVSSADVLQMEDARFADVLEDLARKQNSVSLRKVFGWTGGVVTLFAMLGAGASGFVGGLIVTGLALLAGAWLDSIRRSSVLMYDLDPEAHATYEAVTSSFDALAACVGK